MKFNDAGQHVSQSMIIHWTNFAKSKDPYRFMRILTFWPKITAGNKKYAYFQGPLQVRES